MSEKWQLRNVELRAARVRHLLGVERSTDDVVNTWKRKSKASNATSSNPNSTTSSTRTRTSSQVPSKKVTSAARKTPTSASTTMSKPLSYPESVSKEYTSPLAYHVLQTLQKAAKAQYGIGGTCLTVQGADEMRLEMESEWGLLLKEGFEVFEKRLGCGGCGVELGVEAGFCGEVEDDSGNFGFVESSLFLAIPPNADSRGNGDEVMLDEGVQANTGDATTDGPEISATIPLLSSSKGLPLPPVSAQSSSQQTRHIFPTNTVLILHGLRAEIDLLRDQIEEIEAEYVDLGMMETWNRRFESIERRWRVLRCEKCKWEEEVRREWLGGLGVGAEMEKGKGKKKRVERGEVRVGAGGAGAGVDRAMKRQIRSLPMAERAARMAMLAKRQEKQMSRHQHPNLAEQYPGVNSAAIQVQTQVQGRVQVIRTTPDSPGLFVDDDDSGGVGAVHYSAPWEGIDILDRESEEIEDDMWAEFAEARLVQRYAEDD